MKEKDSKVQGKIIIEEKAKKQLENNIKVESKKEKKQKSVGRILLIVLFVILAVFIFFGGKIRNEVKLNKELGNLFTKKTTLQNVMDYEIVTTGDFAEIEKCVKEYYQELTSKEQDLYNIIEDEKIQSILTANNLKEDGPEFNKSLEYINSKKKKLEETAKSIKDLVTKQNIEKRIEGKDLSDYYVGLYKKYFFADEENLKEELKNKLSDVEYAYNLMNKLYDNEIKILNFLTENKEHWRADETRLVFDNPVLSAQYNSMKTLLYAE